MNIVTLGDKMEPSSLVYLAGLVDGEGSIMLTHPAGTVCVSLFLNITDTYLPVLKWVHEHFGGSVDTHSKAAEGRSQCYRWVLQGKNAYHLIKRLEPFLIIKKLQAQIALEYGREMRYNEGINWCVWANLSKEELAYRYTLAECMKLLNKRP